MTPSLAESFLRACDAASHDGYAAAYHQKLRPMITAVSEVVAACELIAVPPGPHDFDQAALHEYYEGLAQKALTRLREVIDGQGGGV